MPCATDPSDTAEDALADTVPRGRARPGDRCNTLLNQGPTGRNAAHCSSPGDLILRQPYPGLRHPPARDHPDRRHSQPSHIMPRYMAGELAEPDVA
jgi:hypothetical protein